MLRRLWPLLTTIAAVVPACTLDFDALDPRLTTSSASSTVTSSASSSSAGGTTSVTSSSSSVGGGGGAGGQSEGGGGAGPLGPFTNIQPVTELNSAYDDDDPSFTDDLLEVYFNSDRPDGNVANIYRATRTRANEPWGTPELVVEVSSSSSESNCEVSADGLSLWLGRSVAGGPREIFRYTRPNRQASWSGETLVTELNSIYGDTFGRTTLDGLFMVMSSDRDSMGGNDDIFSAQRSAKNAPWSTPVAIPSLALGRNEGEPWMSNDGLEVWFKVFQSSVTQSDDIYRSVRASTDDDWPPPTPVTELNSAASDTDAFLSPDLRFVMFARSTSSGRDIYQATR